MTAPRRKRGDVVQQMQPAETQWRESQDKPAREYDNALCGYHSCDADGVVTRINDTALEWLGCSRADIVGKVRFPALVSARFRAGCASAFARLKASGAPVDIETRLLRRNGAAMHVHVSAVAVTDGRGAFLGSRARVVDITRRKEAERKAARHTLQLQALSRRLVEVQDHERRRLARELHDRIGQNLTALNLNLSTVKSGLPPQSGDGVGARMDDCMRLVRETVETTGDLMTELRPAVLDDYGLVAALRWYGEQFARRTGIATAIQADDAVPRLTQSVETMLFRIVQEACSNIARFAGARAATITVAGGPESIRVEIADDGCGFDSNAVVRRAGHPAWGLLVMRERARIAGGRLRVDSAAGLGTRITVELGG